MSCPDVVIVRSPATTVIVSPIQTSVIARPANATVATVIRESGAVALVTRPTVPPVLSVDTVGVQGPPGSTQLLVEADCLSTDLTYACVYVTGPSVSGRAQVATCDPSSLASMPCIGVISAKSSVTRCTVILLGQLSTTGLIPGRIYYVGATGALSATRPTGAIFVQSVGHAIDETRLVVKPNTHFHRAIA